MTDLLTWSFCALAILASVLLVITRSILYGACLLVICLLSLAALYVLLQAEFVGVTQLMIYVGGIIVLLLFAIMLTNKLKGESLITGHSNRVIAALVFSLSILSTGYMAISWPSGDFAPRNMDGVIHETGVYLMTIYLFPMETVAVLLLLVLIGAITIAGASLRKEGGV